MNRYSWIVIVLMVAAILICAFLKDPPPQREVPLSRRGQTNISGDGSHIYEVDATMPDFDEPSTSNLIRGSFYEKLEGKSIEESVSILSRKGKEAQRIVPQFPNFPGIWLLSPTTKEKYASLGERYCIEFLELLFPGHKFKKIRPKWLRNPKTNRPLELDGYCEELMIAIEYQGKQHYVWPNFTKCSRKEFFAQQERDRIKEETCINKNICLIQVPYTVELSRIPLAVYSKLLDAVPELNLKC